MGRPMLPRPSCAICGSPCKDRGRIYCSRRCQHVIQRGRARPSAVGNSWGFRGENVTVWAHYKRMQKLCPPGQCVECGAAGQTVIHHKDRNPRNTVVENLVRMCRSCHARLHHTREAA